MNTAAGVVLRGEFERFFSELGRPEIRRVRPGTYKTPGDRDTDLEEYPIFDVWRQSKMYFDGELPFKR